MPSTSRLSKLVTRAGAALLPLTFLSLPFIGPIGGRRGEHALPDAYADADHDDTGQRNAEVNVDDFGASGADSADDTAAIQAANDRVRDLGGGTVRFGAGTYIASGVLQDSNATFLGAGPGATTIRHSAPTAKPLIENRQSKTTGSIGVGSKTLTVASAAGIVPGSIVAVKAAGGGHPNQRTTLKLPAFKNQNGLNVNSAKDFATLHDSRYLVVGGSEVVQYYRTNGTDSFSDLDRGRLGTVAKYHPAGAAVAQAVRHVAQVVSVAGNTITLDKPAVLGVRNAQVTTGAYRMSVRSMTIDGNQPMGAASGNQWPLYYALSRWVTITDVVVANSDEGGLRFDTTRDSAVTNSTFRDSGDPEGTNAAHIWLFRGAIRNTISANTFTGFGSHALFIDDRTVDSTEYDAGSDHNVIENNDIELPHTNVGSDGVLIIGSADNTVRNNRISGTDSGISVERSTQGVTLSSPYGADGTRNSITSNTLTGNRIALRVTGTGNSFTQNTIVDAYIPCRDYGTADNTFEGNVVQPSGTCP